MKNAYALLGLSFLIVFGAAYFLWSQRAVAPSTTDLPLEATKETATMTLTLTSPVFKNGETIPAKYTCDGENINPPLTIDGVPDGTESLVLVMDDPDIPEQVKTSRGIEKYDHWVVYNLPPDTKAIDEGFSLGSMGNNSSGNAAYTGPCPPPQYEPTTHRYVFRLYALSGQLNFFVAPTLDELESAAKAEALAHAELIGVYDRTKE